MNKLKDRAGETRLNNKGYKVTILNYHDYNNVDIIFEDGTILYNKSYGNFVKGTIAHPNSKSSNFRIGEENIANNGLSMKIIHWRTRLDIDIQFEDGTVVKNKTYYNFKKGVIGHPNKNTNNKIDSRIGEISITSDGIQMKIVDYSDSQNILVELETGERITTNYFSFKHNKLKYNNILKHYEK